jgi:hypothetical protein
MGGLKDGFPKYTGTALEEARGELAVEFAFWAAECK